MIPRVDYRGVRFGPPLEDPPAWEGKAIAGILSGVPEVLAWVPPGVPAESILPVPRPVASLAHVDSVPPCRPGRKLCRRKFAIQWDQGHALRERAIGKWHL
eukprot:6319158-Amphidinium_carterae.1